MRVPRCPRVPAMVAESALPVLLRFGYHRRSPPDAAVAASHGEREPERGPGLTGLVVLAIAVVLALVGVGPYNSLGRARVRVDEAWSGILTQLKRRHDLVPNLVETVTGYAAHEKGVLEKVTE